MRIRISVLVICIAIAHQSKGLKSCFVTHARFRPLLTGLIGDASPSELPNPKISNRVLKRYPFSDIQTHPDQRAVTNCLTNLLQLDKV